LGCFSEVQVRCPHSHFQTWKTRPDFGSGVPLTKPGFLPHLMQGGELGNPGFPMRDLYLRVLVRFAVG
jgi:hypothetical protein